MGRAGRRLDRRAPTPPRPAVVAQRAAAAGGWREHAGSAHHAAYGCAGQSNPAPLTLPLTLPLPQMEPGVPPGGAGGLSWMTELSRALDHGLQSANTFLETNSALLANTLALDKLSEFDGVEVRTRTGSC